MASQMIDRPPPMYSPTYDRDAASQVNLAPTTPSQNQRYNISPRIRQKPTARTVPAKMRVKSRSEGKPGLGDGWKEWQHPEGDVYAFNLRNRLVTSADVRNEKVRGLLDAAMDIINHKLGLGDLRPIEIYLNPLLNSGPVATVEYYLVDHHTRQIFWLDDVSTEEVGIPEFDSPGYLKSVLTPEYWTHVDYFPMHMSNEDLRPAEEELLLMLAHGRLDVMTSPGSTCPYSAKECAEYIATLETNRKFATPEIIGYRTACVARLWNAMARARHINNFGLDDPRLDRLQGYPEYRQSSYVPNLRLSLFEACMFFIPIPIWERLMNLFNGRVVFQRHWAVFFQDMRYNWFLMGSVAAGTLACDVVLLASKVASVFTAGSASLASASVFTAIYLHQMHPEYELSTGPDISAYVVKYEDYYHGLRPLSIILALPQALTIYAAVLLLVGIAISTIEAASNTQQASSMVAAFAVGAIPLLIMSSFFAPYNPGRPPIWKTIFSRKSADDPNKRQG